MPIPKPNQNEKMSDFMQRCMGDDKMVNEYETEQRAAICRSAFEEKLAGEKVGFDFDDTFSTQKGFDMAVEWKDKGAEIYIISAREQKDGMLPRANKAGILFSKVYATGSNQEKIKKVKDLGLDIFYDNNSDVIKELEGVGRLFK